MAGTTIRELFVALGVEADTAEAEAFDDAVSSMADTMAGAVEVALGLAAGIAAVVGASVAAAVDVGGTAEAIENQAVALGLTTEQYQELAYAMESAGVSADAIGKTLGKVNTVVEAAAGGSDAAVASLDAIGVSYEELQALSPEEQLKVIADGLAGIEDPAERAAAAQALLGTELANQVLPVLAGGAEGLEEMARQAHDLGVVLSEEDLAAAAEFDGMVDQLTATAQGLYQQIGVAVLPVLTELATRLLDWVSANQELIASGIDLFASTLETLLLGVADAFSFVNDAIGPEGWAALAGILAALFGAGGFAYYVAQVVSFAVALGSAIASVVAFVGGGEVLLGLLAGIAAAFSYVVAAVAAFSTVLLVLEDFYTYLTGGDSVIGRFIARFQEADGFAGALARTLSALGNLAGAVFSALQTGINAVLNALSPLFSAFVAFATWLGSGLAAGVSAALNALAPLLDAIATVANGMASLLGGGAPATAGAGTFSATSAAVAPTTSSSFTGATGGAAATGSSVTVGGASVNITGVGISKEEAQAIVNDTIEANMRAAMEESSAQSV